MIIDPQIEKLLRKASPILLPDVFFDSFDQNILNAMLLNSAKLGNIKFFNILLEQGAEITEGVKTAAEGKIQILNVIETYETFIKSFNEEMESLKEDIKNDLVPPANIGEELDRIFSHFLTNNHQFTNKLQEMDFSLNFFERIKVGFISFIKGQDYDEALVKNVSEKFEAFFESIKSNVDKNIGFAAKIQSQKLAKEQNQNQR
ncbi:MAG: hypothetical protein K0R73_1038 [Candidatus Midichloriaceae bacterium]|jgi:hypothetical protein|nr:hypothetical protein [Candidatus Midichloriaceae bacterium]